MFHFRKTEHLPYSQFYPTPVFLGFPGGSVGKESACKKEKTISLTSGARKPGQPLVKEWN